MRRWVVFTQESGTSDVEQVWIFEDEELASAWLQGQLKLNRQATMVKAPVVRLPEKEKVG